MYYVVRIGAGYGYESVWSNCLHLFGALTILSLTCEPANRRVYVRVCAFEHGRTIVCCNFLIDLVDILDNTNSIFHESAMAILCRCRVNAIEFMHIFRVNFA